MRGLVQLNWSVMVVRVMQNLQHFAWLLYFTKHGGKKISLRGQFRRRGNWRFIPKHVESFDFGSIYRSRPVGPGVIAATRSHRRYLHSFCVDGKAWSNIGGLIQRLDQLNIFLDKNKLKMDWSSYCYLVWLRIFRMCFTSMYFVGALMNHFLCILGASRMWIGFGNLNNFYRSFGKCFEIGTFKLS